SGSILIFGGNDGPIVDQIPRAAFRDDTWLFTPGTGWEEVTGDGPRARGRYSAVLDPENQRALLFGGRFRPANQTDDYTLFNDLWSFSFATRAWTKIPSEGGPSPRYYPNAAWDADARAMYVFGGATNTDPLSIDIAMDLWRWTEADGWEELPTSGDIPSTRTFYGTTFDPAGKRMYLFGGQRGDFVSTAYQDFYALDVTTGAWTELNDGRNKAPSTRMHAMLIWDEVHGQPKLFGGHTDIGDGNDLWSFNLSTNKWDVAYRGDTFNDVGLGCLGNPAEVPADYVDQDLTAPERRHRGMGAVMDGNLWIFGGMHSECSANLDDTWRYDLTSNTWKELIPARTGESCARRGDDCQCLCL
ncbi:MAG TPA: kelch repeat-containing protein, partial [Myxococcota bacterium]|nr:kelch repeat-containing protein [Myxococcota bacterium]